MGASMSEVAIVTPVFGRHAHLLNQRTALLGGSRKPDQHVVVSMGDPDIERLVGSEPDCAVVELDVAPPWPLSRARNLGAQVALDDGAEVLVFLDVDCIPSGGLVDRYASVAKQPPYQNGLLCGEVSYLPAQVPFRWDDDRLVLGVEPHPGRPLVPSTSVLATTEYTSFWSLSFAVTAGTWHRLGGFCELYRGYGAEDTDLGQCAQAAAIDMFWVGGAQAFHQYHPVSDPPVEHLGEIMDNARTFRARWGWWPMEDWFEAFQAAGLARYDAARQIWVRT